MTFNLKIKVNSLEIIPYQISTKRSNENKIVLAHYIPIWDQTYPVVLDQFFLI